MRYVVLDTCVLVNCTLMNAVDADPELLLTISNRMRENGLLLLLPAVIELEYSRKVPEQLAFIKQHTEELRKKIGTEVLTPRDASVLHQTLDKLDSARNSAVIRAQEYFSQIANDDSLTVRVPLSGDILAEATTYVLAGRKPAKRAVQGLLDPDCLIVASIASFARSQNLSSKDTILICSDNHSDFGLWIKDAQRHVVAEDIAAAIPCSVRYVKSPRALVEEEFQIDVQADEPLAEALDEYEGLTETMDSVSVLATSEDYYAFTRAQNADIAKYLSMLRSSPYVDIAKYLSMLPSSPYVDIAKDVNPSVTAGLFVSPSLYADFLKHRESVRLKDEEDEDEDATNMPDHKAEHGKDET